MTKHNGFPVVHSKEDFDWYKAELDVQKRYKHQHNGQPEKYPCIVESEYLDDPNGPYTYTHYFTYQQEIVCSECGHKTTVWPEGYRE